MLIRLISDVHGNLAALERVLAHPDGAAADATICLGDVVGYGSRPKECIALVSESCLEVVAGNHDQGAAGLISVSSFNHDGQRAIEWTRTVLEDEEKDWLASLPLHTVYYGVSLTHASPDRPSAWIYIFDSARAVDAAVAAGDCLAVYGHTHIPMNWTRFGECSSAPAGEFPPSAIINCGSVGQPRDGDPRAAYMLLDTEKRTFRHVRVEYDIQAAADSIRESGLPEHLAGRLFLGK